MRIRIISFTHKGYRLSEAICRSMKNEKGILHETELCYKGRKADDAAGGPPACERELGMLCLEAFRDGTALIFIGAAGIAVRSIAPYVRDKLTDPPVIVIDELGRYVIPLLSGHMGGANSLATEIAALTGAEPVITTATDINQAFSVDLFAKENGLRIVNRDGIAKVSSSALRGRPVTISIKDYPPAHGLTADRAGGDGRYMGYADASCGGPGHMNVIISDEDIYDDMTDIRLCPGRYAVGIGCRRGKPFAEIRELAERVLAGSGIDPCEVGAVATIDIKQDEAGIRSLAEYWKVPFITYEASLLAKVQGDFASSEFVKERVGVDNVSERAAVLAAGRGARLVVRKHAENGITIAAAGRK